MSAEIIKPPASLPAPEIHPSVRVDFDGLNLRQSKFLDRYLITGNATESARYAGYNGDDATLAQIGSRLLKSVKLRAELQRRLGKSVASAPEVLEILTKQARGDLTDVLTPDGEFDFKRARRKRLLKKLKVKTERDGSVTHEFEIHDPQAALEKLGRWHKLFTEKTEVELSDDSAGKLAEQFFSLLQQAAQKRAEELVPQPLALEAGPVTTESSEPG